VTVLSDTAIRARDLGEAKALEAKQRAEEAMQNKTSKEDRQAEGSSPAGRRQLAAIRRLPRPRVASRVPRGYRNSAAAALSVTQ
jgi:F-type H+-transporting ATPase subunit epsilon